MADMVRIPYKTMSILNSFVHDIFERIEGNTSKLITYIKHLTVVFRKIQTAFRPIPHPFWRVGQVRRLGKQL
ncbi:histone H2B [Mortierella antarctica]|nr:histone H2B [Mortierella antarctica]